MGNVEEHDVGMDGITSSHSVCFASLGELLRCNTGITPQMHCGSSLRSLQAVGMSRSFCDEWEWARLQAFLGQDGVSCLQGSTPTCEFVLLGNACPYSVIPGMFSCWFTEKRGMFMLASYSDWALFEDWASSPVVSSLVGSSNTIYSFMVLVTYHPELQQPWTN